jgi:hypothetical protein
MKHGFSHVTATRNPGTQTKLTSFHCARTGFGFREPCPCTYIEWIKKKKKPAPSHKFAALHMLLCLNQFRYFILEKLIKYIQATGEYIQFCLLLAAQKINVLLLQQYSYTIHLFVGKPLPLSTYS